MKRLLLSLAVIITAVGLIACSKDKDKGNANPYPYSQINNNYGATPNDPRCGNTAYAGFQYNHPGYVQPGGYYPGQIPTSINCIPHGSIYGGTPYYFQANFQFYLGTCDLRFSGRTQLCPIGYQCRPAFGTMGVCMRGY